MIPNEKLASDTIRNSTIVSREKVAEITVHVPLDPGPRRRVDALLRGETRRRALDVFVSGLDGQRDDHRARVRAEDADAAERLGRELRLRVHERLRDGGVLA